MKKSFYLFLSGCIFSLTAYPQILNIESSRMQSDTTGWMGSFGASFNITKNKVQILGANADAHLQYKTSNDRGLWLLLGNINFLKAEKSRLISDGLVHIRYNRKINEWLRYEIFGQFQNNDIMQIDSRILLGMGPRFKLIKTKQFRLYAASLLMYEMEKEMTNPAIKHRDVRNSSYLSFTFIPQNHLEIISTTYYQPLLRYFNDYRILNQLLFKIKAGTHSSITVRWNYLSDAFPAGTAPKTTYNFATGFIYDL